MDRHPQNISSVQKLAYLQVDGVRIDVLVRCARVSRELDIPEPLRIIYIGDKQGQYRQYQPLKEAMGSGGSVRLVTPVYNEADEEAELMKEAAIQ